MNDRQHDIVVWGATGFTGRAIAAYLRKSYSANGALKWAVAGRSKSKLESILAEIGAPDTPIIVAESDDVSAIERMVKSTRVIIAAAGPFAKFGSNVVAACAAAGTDYVDITGESLWVSDMIEQHATSAAASGARIVHCCGFDCIPFDYGVYFAQKVASEKFGAPSNEVLGRVTDLEIAVSGGTTATAVGIVESASKDRTIRDRLLDSFILAKDPGAQRAKQPDARKPRFDPETGKWAVYFPMAGTNMAIVHRTNMLLGYPYGKDFTYCEMQAVPDEKAAKKSSKRQAMLIAMLAIAPTRALLKRFALPKPGQGPSPEALARGRFEVHFIAKVPSGEYVKVSVSSEKDPGYVSTPLMVAEAAMCLLKDIPREVTPGGFYSPVAAMKDQLMERLKANAGFEFRQLS